MSVSRRPVKYIMVHSGEAVKRNGAGNSLAVQWLGHCTSSAGGMGSIPGWGSRIPQATRHSQNK